MFLIRTFENGLSNNCVEEIHLRNVFPPNQCDLNDFSCTIFWHDINHQNHICPNVLQNESLLHSERNGGTSAHYVKVRSMRHRGSLRKLADGFYNCFLSILKCSSTWIVLNYNDLHLPLHYGSGKSIHKMSMWSQSSYCKC